MLVYDPDVDGLCKLLFCIFCEFICTSVCSLGLSLFSLYKRFFFCLATFAGRLLFIVFVFWAVFWPTLWAIRFFRICLENPILGFLLVTALCLTGLANQDLYSHLVAVGWSTGSASALLELWQLWFFLSFHDLSSSASLLSTRVEGQLFRYQTIKSLFQLPNLGSLLPLPSLDDDVEEGQDEYPSSDITLQDHPDEDDEDEVDEDEIDEWHDALERQNVSLTKPVGAFGLHSRSDAYWLHILKKTREERLRKRPNSSRSPLRYLLSHQPNTAYAPSDGPPTPLSAPQEEGKSRPGPLIRDSVTYDSDVSPITPSAPVAQHRECAPSEEQMHLAAASSKALGNETMPRREEGTGNEILALLNSDGLKEGPKVRLDGPSVGRGHSALRAARRKAGTEKALEGNHRHEVIEISDDSDDDTAARNRAPAARPSKARVRGEDHKPEVIIISDDDDDEDTAALKFTPSTKRSTKQTPHVADDESHKHKVMVTSDDQDVVTTAASSLAPSVAGPTRKGLVVVFDEDHRNEARIVSSNDDDAATPAVNPTLSAEPAKVSVEVPAERPAETSDSVSSRHDTKTKGRSSESLETERGHGKSVDTGAPVCRIQDHVVEAPKTPSGTTRETAATRGKQKHVSESPAAATVSDLKRKSPEGSEVDHSEHDSDCDLPQRKSPRLDTDPVVLDATPTDDSIIQASAASSHTACQVQVLAEDSQEAVSTTGQIMPTPWTPQQMEDQRTTLTAPPTVSNAEQVSEGMDLDLGHHSTLLHLPAGRLGMEAPTDDESMDWERNRISHSSNSLRESFSRLNFQDEVEDTEQMVVERPHLGLGEDEPMENYGVQVEVGSFGVNDVVQPPYTGNAPNPAPCSLVGSEEPLLRHPRVIYDMDTDVSMTPSRPDDGGDTAMELAGNEVGATGEQLGDPDTDIPEAEAECEPGVCYNSEAHYGPEADYKPEAEHKPDVKYDAETEHEPAAEHGPEAEHEAEAEHESEADYNSEVGHEPEANYESQCPDGEAQNDPEADDERETHQDGRQLYEVEFDKFLENLDELGSEDEEAVEAAKADFDGVLASLDNKPNSQDQEAPEASEMANEEAESDDNDEREDHQDGRQPYEVEFDKLLENLNELGSEDEEAVEAAKADFDGVLASLDKPDSQDREAVDAGEAADEEPEHYDSEANEGVEAGEDFEPEGEDAQEAPENSEEAEEYHDVEAQSGNENGLDYYEEAQDGASEDGQEAELYDEDIYENIESGQGPELYNEVTEETSDGSEEELNPCELEAHQGAEITDEPEPSTHEAEEGGEADDELEPHEVDDQGVAEPGPEHYKDEAEESEHSSEQGDVPCDPSLYAGIDGDVEEKRHEEMMLLKLQQATNSPRPTDAESVPGSGPVDTAVSDAEEAALINSLANLAMQSDFDVGANDFLLQDVIPADLLPENVPFGNTASDNVFFNFQPESVPGFGWNNTLPQDLMLGDALDSAGMMQGLMDSVMGEDGQQPVYHLPAADVGLDDVRGDEKMLDCAAPQSVAAGPDPAAPGMDSHPGLMRQWMVEDGEALKSTGRAMEDEVVAGAEASTRHAEKPALTPLQAPGSLMASFQFSDTNPSTALFQPTAAGPSTASFQTSEPNPPTTFLQPTAAGPSAASFQFSDANPSTTLFQPTAAGPPATPFQFTGPSQSTTFPQPPATPPAAMQKSGMEDELEEDILKVFDMLEEHPEMMLDWELPRFAFPGMMPGGYGSLNEVPPFWLQSMESQGGQQSTICRADEELDDRRANDREQGREDEPEVVAARRKLKSKSRRNLVEASSRREPSNSTPAVPATERNSPPPARCSTTETRGDAKLGPAPGPVPEEVEPLQMGGLMLPGGNPLMAASSSPGDRLSPPSDAPKPCGRPPAGPGPGLDSDEKLERARLALLARRQRKASLFHDPKARTGCATSYGTRSLGSAERDRALRSGAPLAELVGAERSAAFPAAAVAQSQTIEVGPATVIRHAPQSTDTA